MAEIMLMMFCFFFETKYLLAMKSDNFNLLKFKNQAVSGMKQLVDFFDVVETVVDVKFEFGNNPERFT